MHVFQAVIIGIIAIAFLIIMDLVSRLCVFLKANRRDEFDWNKLLLFYKQGVAPYFGIWLLYSLINIAVIWLSENFMAIEIPGFADGIMAGLIYAAFAAIVARVGKSIIENLAELGIKKPL